MKVVLSAAERAAAAAAPSPAVVARCTDAAPAWNPLEQYGMQQGIEEEELVCRTCGAAFLLSACEPGVSPESAPPTQCEKCTAFTDILHQQSQKRKAQAEVGEEEPGLPPPKKVDTDSGHPVQQKKRRKYWAHGMLQRGRAELSRL